MVSYSNSVLEIPKERYLTFDQFLDQNKDKDESKIKANSDWIALEYSPPLIGKYKIDSSTVLSISVFSHTIGDDLSNLNRWRTQIGLQPVSQLDNSFEIYSMGDIQVRKVSLSHQDQFMVLYWLSFNNQHVFNKFVSNYPIDEAITKRFVEGQSWDQL